MTKKELKEWVEYQQSQNNYVPMFVRGGGSGWIEPSDNTEEIFGEDYFEEVVTLEERLSDEEERDWVKSRFTFVGEELVDMKVLCLRHNTGWNQENFDIYLCVWDD